jgi:CobQ-like glutamine amidotransferase family enzyme
MSEPSAPSAEHVGTRSATTSGEGFLGSRDAEGHPRPTEQSAPRARPARESTTRIALVYPELLGTYGDGGNALVLSQRLRWRGLDAEVVSVPAGETVPTSCDLYLLGGGEDEPQVLAADSMRRENALLRAVEGGAMVFAVCAGFQIVGETFLGADGKQHDGVGLLGLETRRTFGASEEPVPPRAVGDIVVAPDEEFGLPLLLGYENHGGRTRPTPDAPGKRLGVVRVGVGNGTPDRAEGHVADVGQGRVLATYLHGPVLAQNPALADLLLRWVHPDLAPLDGPTEAERLRRVRLRALDVA